MRWRSCGDQKKQQMNAKFECKSCDFITTGGVGAGEGDPGRIGTAHLAALGALHPVIPGGRGRGRERKEGRTCIELQQSRCQHFAGSRAATVMCRQVVPCCCCRAGRPTRQLTGGAGPRTPSACPGASRTRRSAGAELRQAGAGRQTLSREAHGCYLRCQRVGPVCTLPRTAYAHTCIMRRSTGMLGSPMDSKAS